MKTASMLAMATALGLAPLSVMPAQADEAQNQIQNQVETQTQTRTETQNVYGWQLMTPGERESYMAQMRNAKTQQERDQIRNAHHYEMQQRAKEQGVSLPDMPMGPGAGKGMGQGQGMGQGMGQGQGMGSGMGQGMDPNLRKGMGGGNR